MNNLRGMLADEQVSTSDVPVPFYLYGRQVSVVCGACTGLLKNKKKELTLCPKHFALLKNI